MVVTTKLGKLNLIIRQTDTGARSGTRRAKDISPLSINTYDDDLIPKGSCAYNTRNQDKIETLL